jgi:hypothetical protein
MRTWARVSTLESRVHVTGPGTQWTKDPRRTTSPLTARPRRRGPPTSSSVAPTLLVSPVRPVAVPRVLPLCRLYAPALVVLVSALLALTEDGDASASTRTSNAQTALLSRALAPLIRGAACRYSWCPLAANRCARRVTQQGVALRGTIPNFAGTGLWTWWSPTRGDVSGHVSPTSSTSSRQEDLSPCHLQTTVALLNCADTPQFSL